MLNRRRGRRRMWRGGRTCLDLGRECAMEVEYAMFHYGLDGRTFDVKRLACISCGRQVVTAQEKTGPDPEPDGVEVYREAEPWKNR